MPQVYHVGDMVTEKGLRTVDSQYTISLLQLSFPCVTIVIEITRGHVLVSVITYNQSGIVCTARLCSEQLRGRITKEYCGTVDAP